MRMSALTSWAAHSNIQSYLLRYTSCIGCPEAGAATRDRGTVPTVPHESHMPTLVIIQNSEYTS